MVSSEPLTLRQLALLVVCHCLMMGGNAASLYSVKWSTLPWSEAREYCQRYYVDLAVLSSEEQYHYLLNTTAGEKASLWVGLRYTHPTGWRWVDGRALIFERWYRKTFGPTCASIDTLLPAANKLLPRFCQEKHGFICQGAVPPVQVEVESVGTDHVTLCWDTPLFLQGSDSYNITTCNFLQPLYLATKCSFLLYTSSNSSTSLSIQISSLTPGTQYSVSVVMVIIRPHPVTGVNISHQSDPATVTITTASDEYLVRSVLKSLSFTSLLWVLYLILKRAQVPNQTSVELITEECIVDHLT